MRQVNFDVINFIVSSFLIIKKIIIYCVKVIYFSIPFSPSKYEIDSLHT